MLRDDLRVDLELVGGFRGAKTRPMVRIIINEVAAWNEHGPDRALRKFHRLVDIDINVRQAELQMLRQRWERVLNSALHKVDVV